MTKTKITVKIIPMVFPNFEDSFLSKKLQIMWAGIKSNRNPIIKEMIRCLSISLGGQSKHMFQPLKTGTINPEINPTIKEVRLFNFVKPKFI